MTLAVQTTQRTATVRAVGTSVAPGLPTVGALIGYRRRPDSLGTYTFRVESIDGRPAGGLLLGFPLLGAQHAARTAELRGRLAARSRPLPDGLAAAAVWHGTVDVAGSAGQSAVLAPDPYAEQFVTLHEALATGQLAAQPMGVRFALAHALARAADDLAAIGAVHGGLDAATLLVRLADRRVLISEVESATLHADEGHLPLAVGAATGYLAPELYDGAGEHPEAASAAADHWSLAVALHHVLTGRHPYHFLPDLSPGTVDGYLGGHPWPAHDAGLRVLPDDVRDLFARTFHQGWRAGSARPSAADWLAVLGRWIGDPVIDELRVDRAYVLPGESVAISWRTRFAHRILLDGKDAGLANGGVVVPVDRPRSFTLHAIGPSGFAEARTPRIEVLRVPSFGLVDVRRTATLPPAARPVRAVSPLPARPSLPDPAIARPPSTAPRFTGTAAPRVRRGAPSFPRSPASDSRPLNEGHHP